MSRDNLHPTVPTGLCVAFYKGTRPGVAGLYNRLGRYLDNGPYSHTELVFTDRMSSSSSFMDHGVRTKFIGYSSVGSWDFLPVPDVMGNLEERAIRWFADHDGEAYDVWGNIRFGIGFARESADKSFCSEAIMASFGYAEAYRYGPSGAATILPHHFNTKMIRVPTP
jgi:hypothetical protein